MKMAEVGNGKYSQITPENADFVLVKEANAKLNKSVQGIIPWTDFQFT